MTTTQAELLAFLKDCSTLVLATTAPNGQPQAASLFFAAGDDLRLYWTSSPTSRHSQNLARDPRAAVTVSAQTWAWTEIVGVQMEGEAMVVGEGARQTAWDLFSSKFNFAAEFQAEIARSNFYVFTPHWARLIDNSQGFGHKEEIKISL
jgi:uncharacterized protein YhbP (UPF0306 family)